MVSLLACAPLGVLLLILVAVLLGRRSLELDSAHRRRDDVVRHVFQMLVQLGHIQLLVVAQYLHLARVLFEVGLVLLRVQELVLDLLQSSFFYGNARDGAQDVTGTVSEALDFVHLEFELLEHRDVLQRFVVLSVVVHLFELFFHHDESISFRVVH